MNYNILKFKKYSAVGNDFILLDIADIKSLEIEMAKLAQLLCDRKFGVGADGLLIFSSQVSSADYEMIFFNADGSSANMCGNGARVMLHYASTFFARHGHFLFKMQNNYYTAQVENNRYAINLGVPQYLDTSLNGLLQEDEQGAHIDSGVPYVVILTKNLVELDLELRGKKIRNDKRFPQGTNVVFVEQQGNSFRARIYERGVEAETLSSGTGALASAFFFHEVIGVMAEEIIMPGGSLQIMRQEDSYWLSGKVHLICRGEFYL